MGRAMGGKLHGPPTWGPVSGCRVDGRICTKDTGDQSWSVALGREAMVSGRHLWSLRVGGRTGRMAVGVAVDCEEVREGARIISVPAGAACVFIALTLHVRAQVMAAPGGWTGGGCEGKVWYYTSTGWLRAGPAPIAETGMRFDKGDTILLDVRMDDGEVWLARGSGATSEG